MQRYNPKEIEQKWQDTWEQNGTYRVDLADHSKPKYYGFSMLPGITGAGIHIGHGRTFQFSDIKVRAKRQQGYNAYHPIGWDSFGLPVENYAIKVDKKPRIAHDEAKENFKRQLKRLGYSYDWSKEISTADPEYYKWTQWIFNKLLEHGLAYQKEQPQWWCDTDSTVLANEQVEGGKCWRCGNPVSKRSLKQWFFKITEYADEILEATDDLNWTEMVKTMQKNWIGKSQGTEIEFAVFDNGTISKVLGIDQKRVYRELTHKTNWEVFGGMLLDGRDPEDVKDLHERYGFDADDYHGPTEESESYFRSSEIEEMVRQYRELPMGSGEITFYANTMREKFNIQSSPFIKVYTTRPDTLFGVTFMVLAPEHPFVSSITTDGQKEAVEEYVKATQVKSEIERQENKEKTGVFTGSYGINPVNGEKIPIWIADYVLMGYGTGAIMAVPAHDERDHAFATKFSIPITQVVQPSFIDGDNPPQEDKQDTTRSTVLCVIRNPEDNTYLTLRWKKHPWHTFVTGGVEDGEDIIEAAKREITEETGYAQLKFVRQMPVSINSIFYAAHKDVNRDITVNVLEFELESTDTVELNRDEIEDFDIEWVQKSALGSLRPVTGLQLITDWIENGDFLHTDEGKLINSAQFDGMETSEAREEITAWLEQQGLGRAKTQYKMRDWLISRQRYWGAPIPVVYCEKDGTVPIPDDQLPVVLPDVDDFKPKGGATSVLADIEEWVNTECPKCGGPARRETDTMDGYACSSWYFLRYADPFNANEAWNPAQLKHWAPVDFYNGADHAVAHLLYARFWMRFFYKLGLVGTPEPFKRMMYNAYIMAPDGTKMSKSKGNVIDPMEIMDSGYGADSLRVYEMFIAPYDMDAPWDTRGVPGTYRFLNRVWNLTQEYIEADTLELDETQAAELLKVAHQTAKKVTSDIEHDKFNTAVSSMMETVNTYFKLKESIGIGKNDAWRYAIESLLQILAPFAPHISEELWSQLGHEDTIHIDHWPEWDEKYFIASTMKLPVQVNGKVRATLEVTADASEEDILSQAKTHEKIAPYLDGKELQKAIYVKNRIVNLVTT